MTRLVCRQRMETNCSCMSKLLSFLGVLYVAVFPLSVRSRVLGDHAHDKHDHTVLFHHDRLSSSAHPEERTSDADGFGSEHDETGKQDGYSYLSDFVLSATHSSFPRHAFPSIYARCTERPWIKLPSSCFAEKLQRRRKPPEFPIVKSRRAIARWGLHDFADNCSAQCANSLVFSVA